MSDCSWFQDLSLSPLPTPRTGATSTVSATSSLFLEAPSLGPDPILVERTEFIIDTYPDRRVVRDIAYVYRDVELFALHQTLYPDGPQRFDSEEELPPSANFVVEGNPGECATPLCFLFV